MVPVPSVLRPLARLAQRGLNKFGYRIAPNVDAVDLRTYWLDRLGIDLVLDVGANEGQFVRWMRDRGYKGPIMSFEPQMQAFKSLEKAWGGDRNWTGFHTALGEEAGELTMHIAGNSVSSSLLPMLNSHVEALPESEMVGEETVPIARLDVIISPHVDASKRIFLKIDTQGFEDAVIKGATGMIDRVAFLELELSLVPLYEQQKLLPELISDVQQLGFVPVGLENGFANPAMGRTLQMDGLFVAQHLIDSQPTDWSRA